MSVTSFSGDKLCGPFYSEKLLAQTSKTQVWMVTDGDGHKYAAKLSKRTDGPLGRKPFLTELQVYTALTNGKLKYGQVSNVSTPIGFPNVYYAGTHGKDHDVIVMELLSPDVFGLRNENQWAANLEARGYQLLACDMILALMMLHEHGFVHRNVKPQNFRIADGFLPYLLDFSNAKRYMNRRTNSHYRRRKETRFVGTLKYASLNAHHLRVQSRQDDLISLGYSVIDMIRKRLPWDRNSTDQQTFQDKNSDIMHWKKNIPLVTLCRGLPAGILRYMQTVSSIPFDATPDYYGLKAMLAAET